VSDQIPSTYAVPSSGTSTVKVAILFGSVIALLAANVYLFLQIDHVRQDMGKMREALQLEIANLRESTSVTF